MARRKKSFVEPTKELKEEAESQILQISKTIDYFVSEYTLEILAQKIDNGEYVIPEYQREYTWEHSRKCKFIESILMGLPIPFIFFYQRPSSGKLEIVDGTQRLRTIHEFIYKELILEGLHKLPLLNGFQFSSLKMSRQRKFLNKSIRGIVLSEKADLQARFDLFERINTGSKTANDAEIRRAALPGPFMHMIVQLAEDNFIQNMLPMSEKLVKEREREELITRFFAYGDGLEGYSDNVRVFLYDYCNRMNTLFKSKPRLPNKYKKRLIETFKFVEKHFPNGFKKTQTAKSTPRARFESISIGSFLALKENAKLSPSSKKIARLLSSDKFKDEVRSDGANVIRRLRGRIDATRKILLDEV